MAEIGLTEVISSLREELVQAIREGEGHDIRFEAANVELEFSVGVTRSAEGNAALKFWVIELGGGASYASESIQTVRLTLQPVSVSGAKVRITQGSDENPLASSPEEESDDSVSPSE